LYAARAVTNTDEFQELRESCGGTGNIGVNGRIRGQESMLQRRNESISKGLVPGGIAALIGLVLLACVPDAPGDSENVVGPGPQPTLGEYQVHLRWDPPDEDAAGQPLEDLAGYRLYYAPDLLRRSTEEYLLNTGMQSEALVTGLAAGSWQFAVTAIDTAGNESDLSDIVLVEVGAD
jgi:hypothetical protein